MYNRMELSARISIALESNPRIAVAVLARQLRVDRHTLEKVIREVWDATFREYQRDLLFKRGMALLRDMSVKEAAFTIGYLSADSLSRLVKRTTGRTPTEIMRDTK